MAEMISNYSDASSRSATRFVCISDNHNNYDFSLPEGDILLHSGDFTCNGTEQEIETFLNWLKTLTQYRLKIVIVGNHESRRFYSKKRQKKPVLVIDQMRHDKSLLSNYGIVYLHDQAFQDPVTGWKFYGSGWLSEHCKDQNDICRRWSKIPADTDILLTHGPPHSILDKSSHTPNLGCKELFRLVTTVLRLKLHVFGHVHGGHGQLYDEDKCKQTLFINASLCDSKFRTAHEPIVVDLDKNE